MTEEETGIWANLLKPWPIETIEAAVAEYLRRPGRGFLPSPREIAAIIEQQAGAFVQTAKAEPPPCACDLMKLKGAQCEHGNFWALGGLRNLLKKRLFNAETAEIAEKAKG